MSEQTKFTSDERKAILAAVQKDLRMFDPSIMERTQVELGFTNGKGVVVIVRKPQSDQQIVDGCNELARRFYAMLGYQVPEGYRFDEASHPQEIGMWNMAVEAYEHIDKTSIQDALSNLEE